jgi:xanthosine utilization system XapX-like protein
MKELNHAYTVLKDPIRRRAYDYASNAPPPQWSGPGTAPAPISTSWTVAWLLATAYCGYSYAVQTGASSVLAYAKVAIVALLNSWYLVLHVVRGAFRAGFPYTHENHSGEFVCTCAQLVLHGVALIVAGFLFVLALQLEVPSPLPYVALLGAAGFLSGSSAAMIAYLARWWNATAETKARHARRSSCPLGLST